MNTTLSPDPKRRRPWRLRTRLALAIVVVFMPITALVMVSHIENLSDRRDSRLQSLQVVGETVAASVDGFTRDLESFSTATAVALGDADLQLDQAALGPYLARIQQSYGNLLRSVFITDTSGRVISSGAGDSTVGVNLSDRSYVKALQSGADSTWSGAVVGSETGKTTLVHGRVIRTPSGQRRGFLLIAFYPEVLAKERFPADVPEDGDVSLIDDMGAVLYSSKATDATANLNVGEDPVFRQAHNGEHVELRSEDSPLSSEKSYGVFVPVPKTKWVVGFTRPASAIDGPLQERFFRDLLIVTASIIAGFAAMLIAASRLSRPLSRLAFAAGAIARGERPVLPTAAADAEVRELEIAMDTMSRAVTERQERLAQQARVLETLERVGEIMAELDFRKVAQSITQATLDLTQADAAGIFYRPLFDEGDIELASYAGDVPGFPLQHDDEIVRLVLAGDPVDIADLSTRPGVVLPLDKDRTRVAQSLLGMPMRSRAGLIVGGLFLIREQKEAFGDYERRLASGLARRAGMAMENARMYSISQETQEQLTQANVAKTEFIGMLSHELRTPLTTIYGGARLLHTRRDSLPEQDAIELIESIEEESERLRRLVENLLALARADIGEEVSRDIISVGPVVDQTVKQFANRRPGRPIEVHLHRDLPPVLAEPTYVRQVVHNLITNADKYSPSGLPIDVDVSARDDDVEVCVLDRGPGVPPEEINRIFGSFYRSERTARQATGKGLGLTVCRRLVEAMGGTVWARPRDGGGLAVGFTLPLAREEEEEAIAAQAEG
jgi:signal transduction histidine kinase